MVSTVDGLKPIKDIKVAEEVYTAHDETGEKGIKKVKQIFISEANKLVHVHVDGEEIKTTPEHPFYVPQKGWTAAEQLRAGDKLLLKSGKIVIVEMVQHEILEKPVKVYNFEVEDYHTYYVGEQQIWVHNTCKPKNYTPKGSGKKGAFNAAKRKAGIPRSEQPIKVTRAIDRKGKIIPGRDYYFKNGKIIRNHSAGHYFKDTGSYLGPHYNYGKMHFFY